MTPLEQMETNKSWIGTFIAPDSIPMVHCLMVEDNGVFWRLPFKESERRFPVSLRLLKKDLQEGRMVPCRLNVALF